MDIAKIRKKARKKEKEKKAEEIPVQKSDEEKKEDIATPDQESKDIQKEPVSPVETVADETEAVVSEKDAEREDEEIPEESEDLLELLTFGLAKEEFALRVSDVEEIVNYQSVTKLPTVPDYVLGITSLRGKIIPVIDFKIRLGLKRHTIHDKDQNSEIKKDVYDDTDEKVLIISGPKGFIGVTIDNVMGVIKLPVSRILEPPAHLTEVELKFIEGVVIYEDRFISIIRVEDTINIEVG